MEQRDGKWKLFSYAFYSVFTTCCTMHNRLHVPPEAAVRASFVLTVLTVGNGLNHSWSGRGGCREAIHMGRKGDSVDKCCCLVDKKEEEEKEKIEIKRGREDRNKKVRMV